MCQPEVKDDPTEFDRIIGELRNLSDFDLRTLEKHIKWCNQLAQLASTYGQVSTFASQFDYSNQHKYNGARTFMKMVRLYFDQIGQTLQVLKKHPKNSKNLQKVNILRGQCPVYNSMGDSMNRINQIRLAKSDQFRNNKELVADGVESYFQAQQEVNSDKLIHYYDFNHGSPWIPRTLRTSLKLAVAILYFFTVPLSKSISGVFSTVEWSKFYVNQVVVKCSVSKIPKLINNFYKCRFFRFILWVTNLINFNVKVCDLIVTKRQSDWIIGPNSIERNNNNMQLGTKAIECVLLKPRKFTSDNLIVFIHGGGFSAFTSKSSINILRSIVKSTGAAVLSIEYSLSPEVKHPVALQECLDVYLNLLSPNPITGFRTKKVLLAGDSAGGHLAISMSIAIAEIREVQMSCNEPLTPLPDGVNAVYPITTGLMGHLWPSRALMDPILSPGVVSMMSNAHSGPIEDEIYLKEHKCSWQMDEVTRRKVMNKVNSNMDDPFFHLIGYGHFDRLKSVPLYIQASEFDLLLDDSIVMAKCWKGPVVLDIVPNGTHGWMLYDFLMPKKFSGRNLVIKRLKEAFDRKSEA